MWDVVDFFNWPHMAVMIILVQGSNADNQLVMMTRSFMSMMITVDQGSRIKDLRMFADDQS